ncbi:MAG: Na+ dependent nucleoside transporter N-terminal domain-containing protein, partial [Alphaproteobacteria bacterium]|nr:Na+ dependent nucleoside transporter N-terminal domain-containing protein [Alphaproteobacteria bacterium]
MIEYIQPVLGLLFLVGLAWALSEDRRRGSIRLVLIG